MIEEWIKDLALPGGIQALLLKDIHRRLKKGANDRHTTLDKQYINVADGLNGRRGKIGILDTPAQGEFQSSNLMVFFSSH